MDAMRLKLRTRRKLAKPGEWIMWFPNGTRDICINSFVYSLSGPTSVDSAVAVKAAADWDVLPREPVGRLAVAGGGQLLLDANRRLRFRVSCGNEEEPPTLKELLAEGALAEQYADFIRSRFDWPHARLVRRPYDGENWTMNGTPTVEPGELVERELFHMRLEEWRLGGHGTVMLEPARKLFGGNADYRLLNTWVFSGFVNGPGPIDALQSLSRDIAILAKWRGAFVDFRAAERGGW